MKCLKEDLNELKISIRQASGECVASELIKLKQNYYECTFLPKSVQRHFVDVFFDDKLVNSGK